MENETQLTDEAIKQAIKRASYEETKAQQRIQGMNHVLQARKGRTSVSEAAIVEEAEATLRAGYVAEMARRRKQTKKPVNSGGMLFG